MMLSLMEVILFLIIIEILFLLYNSTLTQGYILLFLLLSGSSLLVFLYFLSIFILCLLKDKLIVFSLAICLTF